MKLLIILITALVLSSYLFMTIPVESKVNLISDTHNFLLPVYKTTSRISNYVLGTDYPELEKIDRFASKETTEEI